MGTSVEYRGREATDKGDIIKPATTVASRSSIPQKTSEELCKMDTSQLSPPNMSGNWGIYTLTLKSHCLKAAPMAWNAHERTGLAGLWRKALSHKNAETDSRILTGDTEMCPDM